MNNPKITLDVIQAQFISIDDSILTSKTVIDYQEITLQITKLADDLMNYDDDSEELWYLEGNTSGNLFDLIVGAYWHYSEWHGGQQSSGYKALSGLGRVYTPGMSTVDDDDSIYYPDLNDIAEEYFRD